MVIPITLTLCVVVAVGSLLDRTFGRVIRVFLPGEWAHWRGAGVAASLLLVFLLGSLYSLPPVRAAWWKK